MGWPGMGWRSRRPRQFWTIQAIREEIKLLQQVRKESHWGKEVNNTNFILRTKMHITVSVHLIDFVNWNRNHQRDCSTIDNAMECQAQKFSRDWQKVNLTKSGCLCHVRAVQSGKTLFTGVSSLVTSLMTKEMTITSWSDMMVHLLLI